MSRADMKCNVCGVQLAKMSPEMEAKAVQEAIERGSPLEKQTVVVCDACWQRALRRGWHPKLN